MNTQTDFDVIIVGGSYAGLSAALALGRALRRVLLIDGGKPCNRQTPHAHNFITRDGATPKEIRGLAVAEVRRYDTVQFMEGYVGDVSFQKGVFEVHVRDNQVFSCRKLLLATGLEDLLPPLTGFRESWGISILHCPYCHGYEVKGQKTVILANGEAAWHYGVLLRNWTDDLTVLTNGKADFTEVLLAQLTALGVAVLESRVTGLAHDNGQLRQVLFEGRPALEVGVMYSHVPFRLHSELPERLGCALAERGLIRVDDFQKTSVEGVFAAGDNSSPMRSVAVAVASGQKAGAAINWELIREGLG